MKIRQNGHDFGTDKPSEFIFLSSVNRRKVDKMTSSVQNRVRPELFEMTCPFKQFVRFQARSTAYIKVARKWTHKSPRAPSFIAPFLSSLATELALLLPPSPLPKETAYILLHRVGIGRVYKRCFACSCYKFLIETTILWLSCTHLKSCWNLVTFSVIHL